MDQSSHFRYIGISSSQQQILQISCYFCKILAVSSSADCRLIPEHRSTKLEVKFRKRIYNAIQHFDKTGMAGSGLEKVLEEGKSLSPGGVLGTKSFMEEGGAAEEEIRP